MHWNFFKTISLIMAIYNEKNSFYKEMGFKIIVKKRKNSVSWTVHILQILNDKNMRKKIHNVETGVVQK